MQHSQASPNRCCQSTNSSQNSQNSLSSTLTTGSGGKTSQLSSSIIDSSDSRTKLVNGFCDNSNSSDKGIGDSASTSTTTAPTPRKDHNDKITNNNNLKNKNTSCKCKCDPKDFKINLSNSQELRKETCKLVNSVSELRLSNRSVNETKDKNCIKKCECSCDVSDNAKSKISNTQNQVIDNIQNGNDTDDDWSLMLIGLAQIHPTAKLVQMDPFDALPTISVVPPTPEGLFSKFSTPLLWDNSKLCLDDIKQSRVDNNDQQNKQHSPDVSPEDSPQDEEPPYRTLKTSLKRYITSFNLRCVNLLIF